MSNLSKEFEPLLGHAAFRLWPDLLRDMQERLFEAAVSAASTQQGTAASSDTGGHEVCCASRN